jgi:protein-lysine N-methyltransferase EEF2KMT
MASIAGTEDVSRLIAQYFELVDLRNLTIPSSSVLKNPVTQNRIYNEMFNGDLLTPVIPPAAYRLRLLKKLIAVIENDDLWDPEEDVCNLFVYCIHVNLKHAHLDRANKITIGNH